MKLRNVLLGTAFTFATAVTQAAPVTIDSYNVDNARTAGYGGWQHTYNGTVSPVSGSLANYSNGSGTLNDGAIGTNVSNTQLFSTPDNAAIDLFLGESSTLNTLSLFSFANNGNGIPGNITGLNVTINGVTDYFSTTGFGGPSAGHANAHELVDLSGSLLDGLVADVVTLSDFTTTNSWSQYFSISEIQIDGLAASVPEPGSLALLLVGLAGLGATRKYNKA